MHLMLPIQQRAPFSETCTDIFWDFPCFRLFPSAIGLLLESVYLLSWPFPVLCDGHVTKRSLPGLQIGGVKVDGYLHLPNLSV